MPYHVRYHLEHRLFPHEFFEKKELFIAYLSAGNKALFASFRNAYLLEDSAFPYQEEEFSVDYFSLGDDQFLVRLGLPKPEQVPDCHIIYLFFDKTFAKQRYFTVEEGVEGEIFLCEWERGCHLNHGLVTLDDQALVENCRQRFLATELTKD